MTELIDVAGVALASGSIVATAVWGVGKLNAAIVGLRTEVKSLACQIERLAEHHETTDLKVANISERVVRLESMGH